MDFLPLVNEKPGKYSVFIIQGTKVVETVTFRTLSYLAFKDLSLLVLLLKACAINP